MQEKPFQEGPVPPAERKEQSGPGSERAKEEELIHFDYQQAKEVLRQAYDIDDLTPIEAVRLRQITKEVLAQARENFMSRRKGEVSERSLFLSTHHEVVARWLYDLYGIRYDDVHGTECVEDVTTREKFNFPYYGSAEAKQKRQEIRDKGHDVYIRKLATEAFKKYLRRIRKKAHQP